VKLRAFARGACFDVVVSKIPLVLFSNRVRSSTKRFFAQNQETLPNARETQNATAARGHNMSELPHACREACHAPEPRNRHFCQIRDEIFSPDAFGGHLCFLPNQVQLPRKQDPHIRSNNADGRAAKPRCSFLVIEKILPQERPGDEAPDRRLIDGWVS